MKKIIILSLLSVSMMCNGTSVFITADQFYKRYGPADKIYFRTIDAVFQQVVFEDITIPATKDSPEKHKKLPVSVKIVVPDLNKMVGFTYVPTEGKFLNKNIFIIIHTELIKDYPLSPIIKVYAHEGNFSREYFLHLVPWTEIAESKSGLVKDPKELVGKINQELQQYMVTVLLDGSIQIKNTKDDKDLKVLSLDTLG